MRQNLVFSVGFRSRYLLPGIQTTFTVFKTSEFRNRQFFVRSIFRQFFVNFSSKSSGLRNFEIVNISCVISRNILLSSEFIFEVL